GVTRKQSIGNRFRKLIKFSQWVLTQGEFSVFQWPEEEIEVIECSIKKSKPPKGYASYRGRYLSARYSDARYLSSNFPKEYYDAFLQLTKGASLDKSLAKISRGQNARNKSRTRSVEILTLIFINHPISKNLSDLLPSPVFTS
ncbi:hypothetical protein AVEN_101512-1, partial [Araneus ventricosus]